MNKEERPWGWFEILTEDQNYKVKRIYIKPNNQFSLQYHNQRSEYWVIVEGSGSITLDETSLPVFPGDCFTIKEKMIHRLSSYEEGITFIEVQKGICSEEDIVRLKDDYGRN